MSSRHESNGHHGTWEAWSAQAAKALKRRPLSLAEAKAAFAAAPAVELEAAELDTICQAGIALYGETFERDADGNAPRGSQRHAPHHGLLHERLDRRELPTSLTMFACPVEVTEVSTQFTPASDALSVDPSWTSERHFVGRAAWQGTSAWTPDHDPSADTGIASHEVDWQDTFEAESHLALFDLVPTHADVMHEAVFSQDGWLETV